MLLDGKTSAEDKQAPIGKIVPASEEADGLQRAQTKTNLPEELKNKAPRKRMTAKDRINS